jgi:hypothetical protein
VIKMEMQETEIKMAGNESAPKLPDKKFKAGGVTATVWKGISTRGTYYNVQLGRSYKDRGNDWKNTNSLMENDLPKAMVLLRKAYEYVLTQNESTRLN